MRLPDLSSPGSALVCMSSSFVLDQPNLAVGLSGKIDDDPLVFAATDRVSYAVALLVAIAIVAAL